MATLSVKVSIAPLGAADFRLTRTQLKAWEVVRFDVGQGGTKLSVTAASIGNCYYVKDCTVDVPVAVTFMMASELPDNIANAQTTAVRNDHRNVLLRIQSHAQTHHHRVVTKVIPAWETAIKKDLTQTLPASHTPTSDTERDIQARVAPLVEYWVRELGYRTAYDVHQWEQLDYPLLEKFLQNLRAVPFFLGLGFPVPAFTTSTVARPTITFPACAPRKK